MADLNHPLWVRAVLTVDAYICGLIVGAVDVTASLFRMVRRITWPVGGVHLMRLIWRCLPTHWPIQHDLEYHKQWAGDPFEVHCMAPDWYIITWGGWRLEVWPSERIGQFLSRWFKGSPSRSPDSAG